MPTPTATPNTPADAPGLPVLPEAKMHLHTVMETGVGTVISNEKCTASSKAAGVVRHVAIDVSATQIRGNFLAGQSFGVIPPGADAKGNTHKLRLYSIASPTRGEDGQGAVLATTVKRLIDEHWDTQKLFLGVASNYLCDLKPGDTVTITGPAGKRFLLPADPALHDYLFVATGTGIAPFRGMTMDLQALCPAARTTLVMGAPYASDLLYHDQFKSLAKSNPAFRYWTALSRERQGKDSGDPALENARPMYVQNRLAADPAELIRTLNNGRTLLYICGIAGMELGIFQTLARTLPRDLLSLYIDADDAAMASIDTWDRKMIHKQVRPTRRVFLEVY